MRSKTRPVKKKKETVFDLYFLRQQATSFPFFTSTHHQFERKKWETGDVDVKEKGLMWQLTDVSWQFRDNK